MAYKALHYDLHYWLLHIPSHILLDHYALGHWRFCCPSKISGSFPPYGFFTGCSHCLESFCSQVSAWLILLPLSGLNILITPFQWKMFSDHWASFRPILFKLPPTTPYTLDPIWSTVLSFFPWHLPPCHILYNLHNLLHV